MARCRIGWALLFTFCLFHPRVGVEIFNLDLLDFLVWPECFSGAAVDSAFSLDLGFKDS